MKRHVLKAYLALSGALIVPVSSASSEVPIYRAYYYENASFNFDNETRTSGFLFRLSSPVSQVNALGYNEAIFSSFNQAGPYNEPLAVGLWDANGTLLASTKIGPFDFDRSFSNYLWKGIPTLNLGPGLYTIGGTSLFSRLYPSDAAIVHNSSGFTWLGGRFQDSSEGELTYPVFPSDRGGANGFLHVNLSVRPVPEPATWALLLLGFGAIGGTIRARKRQKVNFTLRGPGFI